MRILFFCISALLAVGTPDFAAPDLLDRIAVRVGKDVITEGEVLDEIRITAYLNRTAPDFSAVARRRAAERLVDQDLIRHEMVVTNYPEPEASQADRLLANFKKSHFRDDAQYRAALARYGITEGELKDHLLWQLAALRFTNVRFGSESPQPPQPLPHLEDHASQRAKSEASAEAWPAPGAGQTGRLNATRRRRDSGEQTAAPSGSVDAQMDAWLKDARQRTSIEFYKEAFE